MENQKVNYACPECGKEYPTVRFGDRFTIPCCWGDEENIIASISVNEVVLISLKDGNRWVSPVKVRNSNKITPAEFDTMLGSKRLEDIFKTRVPKEPPVRTRGKKYCASCGQELPEEFYQVGDVFERNGNIWMLCQPSSNEVTLICVLDAGELRSLGNRWVEGVMVADLRKITEDEMHHITGGSTFTQVERIDAF